jgi:hypothetical protein
MSDQPLATTASVGAALIITYLLGLRSATRLPSRSTQDVPIATGRTTSEPTRMTDESGNRTRVEHLVPIVLAADDPSVPPLPTAPNDGWIERICPQCGELIEAPNGTACECGYVVSATRPWPTTCVPR